MWVFFLLGERLERINGILVNINGENSFEVRAN